MVHTAQGSDPHWNENFVFTISDGASELNLKIMDKDTFTKDDFVGEATSVIILSTCTFCYL